MESASGRVIETNGPANVREFNSMKRMNWREPAGLALGIFVGSLLAFTGALVLASGWTRLLCLPTPGVVETVARFAISDHLLPRIDGADVAAQFDPCLYVLISGAALLVTGLLLMFGTATR